MASHELNLELGYFGEESSEFNLDLIDFSEYTPISKIEPISFYNIIGVLTDFDGSIKIDQEYRFKLMDSGGSIKINYYNDYNQIHHPSFSQEYQVIIIRNVIFTMDKNGSLVGLLNQNSWYKILTNEDINKCSEIAKIVSKVKEVRRHSSLIFSKNIGDHQATKRVRYTEYTENEQHVTNPTSQNEYMLENNPTISSKSTLSEMYSGSSNTLLNSLADAQPYNTYQIIVQVVRLEQTYPNRSQYIITDYSSSDKFRKTSVKLPNSKFLSGRYFVNLTVWDDQRGSIELFKFYRFSMVRGKLDRMGNIELSISGTRSNVDSSITTLLSINQMECSIIKKRMIAAIENNINNSTSPVSSEAIRKSRFCLVKDLTVNTYYDMALLILKKIDNIESENLTLICTDFTPNSLLRNSLSIEYNRITINSDMVIRLIISGNTRLAINEIFKKNPYILILQLLNLKVGFSDIYGVELVLKSNASVKVIENNAVLNYDPIIKKESSYYKKLIRRYEDLIKQSKHETSSSTIPGARPMTEEELI